MYHENLFVICFVNDPNGYFRLIYMFVVIAIDRLIDGQATTHGLSHRKWGRSFHLSTSQLDIETIATQYELKAVAARPKLPARTSNAKTPHSHQTFHCEPGVPHF